MNTIFSSVLQSVITRYLTHKEALGRRYTLERDVLSYLDRFLKKIQAADLTAETFKLWCDTQKHISAGVRRNRMRIVRNFCLYRQRIQPSCFVPDFKLMPSPHQPIMPYIFKVAEIARLIEATHTLKPVSYLPLRAWVFRLAIVLLYTAGLRRGELLRLTIKDYDSISQTLLIRESKFHKSRLLPLSADAAKEIDSYLLARKRLRVPVSGENLLMWNGYNKGRAYTAVGLRSGIQVLLHSADIHTPEGRLPRIHDFRHCFAVHALLRWYRKGIDINSKLPLLASYMGHVSITSTEYYLRFVDTLFAVSSRRFADRYGGLVVPLSAAKGGQK